VYVSDLNNVDNLVDYDCERVLYYDQEKNFYIYNLLNNELEVSLMGGGYPVGNINDNYFVFLNGNVNKFAIGGYLTIVASPSAIPLKIFDGHIFGDKNYRPAETTQYADFTGNKYPDMFTGRIFGITISDSSSYMARSLFDDVLYPSQKRINLIASSPDVDYYIINKTLLAGLNLEEAGYEVLVQLSEKTAPSFEPEYWEEGSLIAYFDHGNSNWAGISSSNIPQLTNSIILNDACSTAETTGLSPLSFSDMSIRRGALAHIGALNIAEYSDFYEEIINNLYHFNMSIGEAYTSDYKSDYIFFLGDPTLKSRKTRLLGTPIDWRMWEQ
jgi:hypothetical protein